MPVEKLAAVSMKSSSAFRRLCEEDNAISALDTARLCFSGRQTRAVPELVVSFMDDLQRRGISFAIDDFGAGYTALRHFKDFSFDVLKIDGQFCQGIAGDPDNQVLVGAMVKIAEQFDMFTVAEMVESREDAECLAALGIDCLQGFLFAAPSVRPPWRREDAAQRVG